MEPGVLDAGRLAENGVNGEEFLMTSGDYTAGITARGAAIAQLRHRGRDLVVPFDPALPIPDYRGIIAAPWPNRVADGAYRWKGVVQHLPLNEPGRDNALHGLVFDRLWEMETHDAESLTLRCRVDAANGYPSSLAVAAEYRLDADGLHCTVTATNTGMAAAPYGVCPHPYLVAGPAPLDDWALHVDAGSFLNVTPDRLLPVALQPVDGHVFDFRTPRSIGATEIDHAFTHLALDGTGESRLMLTDPSGSSVGMRWDASCPWLQIHTADKPAPSANRLGLAVEPMTCPPDAFNSGTDLIILAPGTRHSTRWTIFAR